jgi:hypothetical protein
MAAIAFHPIKAHSSGSKLMVQIPFLFAVCFAAFLCRDVEILSYGGHVLNRQE